MPWYDAIWSPPTKIGDVSVFRGRRKDLTKESEPVTALSIVAGADSGGTANSYKVL
jgi:hypothetical protein